MDDHVVNLDCRQMRCPKPIVMISRKMKELEVGMVLRVEADDPAFHADVEAWVSQSAAAVVSWGEGPGGEVVELRKTEQRG